jgi:hypothetical protein
MASNHKIINRSGDTIAVVMDSNRESHEIPPNGQAIFVKANPFDKVTFHVFRDWNRNGQPNRDQYVMSEQIGYWEAISAHCTRIFNGTQLEKE